MAAGNPYTLILKHSPRIIPQYFPLDRACLLRTFHLYFCIGHSVLTDAPGSIRFVRSRCGIHLQPTSRVRCTHLRRRGGQTFSS